MNHESLLGNASENPDAEKWQNLAGEEAELASSEQTEKDTEKIERMRKKLIEHNAISAIGGMNEIYSIVNEYAYSEKMAKEVAAARAEEYLHYISPYKGYIPKEVGPIGWKHAQPEPKEEANALYRIGLLSIAGSVDGLTNASRAQLKFESPSDYPEAYGMNPKEERLAQRGYTIAKEMLPELIEKKIENIFGEEEKTKK